ncbi:MAG: diguanylate cyclase [Lachnospiraceae bacterium]|nr:diguanylate cyclase [Lachnospiraceae bacterium]MDD3615788.1 diguanylate cyclase [Lachnospiraceae bacterium]
MDRGKEFQRVKENEILIVDDSELERELLKKYLDKEFSVHCCESAEEAMEYLKDNPGQVRLILLDYMMPGMSGMEFLNICHEDEKLKSIPKIMITSNDRPKDQIQAFRAGAFDYITKPPIPEIVNARIHHAMDLNRQIQTAVSKGEMYQHEAAVDKATGLLNKISFQQECEQYISKNVKEQIALLVIDIDDFKKINDNYGHLYGDEVIKVIADELKLNFRESDYVGRFGGDEFVVLMNSITRRGMTKRKAEDVIKAVIFKCTQQLHINVTLSIGIAFQEVEDDFQSLFQRADQALYEAKNTGKGKSVVFGERVPEVEDDNKPLILVSGTNEQLYATIALAYGDTVGFVHVMDLEGLKKVFKKYKDRIKVICMDISKSDKEDADSFLACIEENGGRTLRPLIGICEEGNMSQLREALDIGVSDILTLPLQMDVIQRKLSRAILNGVI